MSDQMIVIGTFVLSYGVMLGYATYLYLRRRRAGN